MNKHLVAELLDDPRTINLQTSNFSSVNSQSHISEAFPLLRKKKKKGGGGGVEFRSL